MSTLLHPVLTYGTVIGLFKTIEVDGYDEDDLPDHYPMKGTIKFAPSVRHSQYIDAEGVSVTFYRTDIIARLDEEGYITSGVPGPDGKYERGVKLLASDNVNLRPSDWTWTVTFNLSSYTGASVSNTQSFSFKLAGGEELDLTKAIPVATSPGFVSNVGPVGPANNLEIGVVEFIPGSAIDSQVVDQQISTPGTIANFALIEETRKAVMDKAGSFLMDPFSVGTVTTGLPGSAASATITGESPNKVLNLELPQGTPGSPTAFELRGTGSPLGVVTAPPGTYYTDTVGTMGAWRWLKTSGTGNTGWVVITGDTGVHQYLDTHLLNGFTQYINNPAYRPRVSRVGDTVFWSGSIGGIQTGKVERTICAVPRGFWPHNTNSAFGHIRAFGGGHNAAITSIQVTGTGLLTLTHSNPDTTLQAGGISFTYQAHSEWPTTYPGVPA